MQLQGGCAVAVWLLPREGGGVLSTGAQRLLGFSLLDEGPPLLWILAIRPASNMC